MKNNFNELYKELINDVLSHGQLCKPRGKEIKELIGYQFELTNPNNSLCTIEDRKMNYAFTIVEMFEYLYGESIPERLCFYNSNMKNYINPSTNQFDGAYAPRIKHQLENCYNILLQDKDSRQAVITIRNANDTLPTVDFPCTLSFQFLLRENKLNMIVTMRSSDLLWGIPYDVNAFCFIQKNLASWLGVENGTYIHQSGSLHIYLDTLDKFSFIDSSAIKDISLPNLEMNFDETYSQLKLFFNFEKALREGYEVDEEDLKELNKNLLPYWEIVSKYIKNKK